MNGKGHRKNNAAEKNGKTLSNFYAQILDSQKLKPEEDTTMHNVLRNAPPAWSPDTAKARRKAAFFCDPVPFLPEHVNAVDWVYGAGRRRQVEALVDCFPTTVNSANFQELACSLRDVEVIFSTWMMPLLNEAQLAQMPKLQVVFFAAGSVKSFARLLLERGITVVSAWAANAVPVAEYTLAQILLSNKGYFRNLREYTHPKAYTHENYGEGNFGETIAILGAGQIGRKLIEMLKPFHLKIIVCDPFLSEQEAAELGVGKVSMEEAFSRGLVVSNHIANLKETEGLLDGRLFSSMRQGATFINTGRGATVKESELIRVMQMRPDLTALLDVTYPEPPVADSLLFKLPNILVTSHIAGSKGDEVIRMADYMIEEYKAWDMGKPLRYAITHSMLENMG